MTRRFSAHEVGDALLDHPPGCPSSVVRSTSVHVQASTSCRRAVQAVVRLKRGQARAGCWRRSPGPAPARGWSPKAPTMRTCLPWQLAGAREGLGVLRSSSPGQPPSMKATPSSSSRRATRILSHDVPALRADPEGGVVNLDHGRSTASQRKGHKRDTALTRPREGGIEPPRSGARMIASQLVSAFSRQVA